MVKTIKIGNSSYDMKSSAYTMFAYKNEMGKDLLEEINDINSLYSSIASLSEEEQQSKWLIELTPIVEKTLRIAYIMICEQNKSFKSYDEWLKDLDYLFDDINWIMEVLQLAMTPFQGRVQG